MFKNILFLLILTLLTTNIYSNEHASIYDFTLKDIDGNEVTLDKFRGKTIMIVNVASQCAFTPQYEGLESLYKQYKDMDFVILGFPANDFLWQESGTNEEIKSFCTVNYAVTFPMFSKIKVTGRTMEPLYKFLTDKETNPDFGGRITWNFNKFLIDSGGNIVNRFKSATEPLSEDIISAIENTLK